MKFTKMHGLGNDYIYINLFNEPNNIDYGKLSIKLSDRHMGIGADGIITIGKSDKADYFMQIYNADGSKGEMCGNGIRCVAKYVYENHMCNKDIIDIETLAGVKRVKLKIVNDKVKMVSVDMGLPMCHDGSMIDKDKITHKLEINNKKYEVMDVSVGNPHTVLFVKEITDDLVLNVGKQIENHPFYPNRTNVEFVKVIDDNILEMRVYERGSGETMACGTGATASSIAYMLKNPNIQEVIVKLRGGDLKVKWDKKKNHLYMKGPAMKVFDGEFDLEDYK